MAAPTVDTVTESDLADSQIIILAGVDVSQDARAKILRLCRTAGVAPLIIVVDHEANLRFVSADELASTSILVVKDRTWGEWEGMLELLGQAIERKCEQLGVKPPLIMTADHPEQDVAFAIHNAADARTIIDYLTERYAL